MTGATLNSASATTSLLGPLLDNTQNQSDPTTMPKAAVKWILFNDQFVPVASGTDLVGSTGDAFKPHGIMNQQMIANGYLYVYCSNESDIDVYFDNLQVVNKRGPILEETHYYPFGMAMAGISDRAWNKLQNFNHFNGNELQTQEFNDGTGLEEYDFNARTYDQQLGRFMQQDPASLSAGQERLSPYQFGYNNPATYNDPDGKCPPCILALAGAIVGGVLNLATHWSAINEGGSFSWGTFGSAFAVGAISGAAGAFTGGSSYAAIGIAGFWGGAFSGAIGEPSPV